MNRDESLVRLLSGNIFIVVALIKRGGSDQGERIDSHAHHDLERGG
jgi:hypothetical protein